MNGSPILQMISHPAISAGLLIISIMLIIFLVKMKGARTRDRLKSQKLEHEVMRLGDLAQNAEKKATAQKEAS